MGLQQGALIRRAILHALQAALLGRHARRRVARKLLRLRSEAGSHRVVLPKLHRFSTQRTQTDQLMVVAHIFGKLEVQLSKYLEVTSSAKSRRDRKKQTRIRAARGTLTTQRQHLFAEMNKIQKMKQNMGYTSTCCCPPNIWFVDELCMVKDPFCSNNGATEVFELVVALL